MSRTRLYVAILFFSPGIVLLIIGLFALTITLPPLTTYDAVSLVGLGAVGLIVGIPLLLRRGKPPTTTP